MSWTDEKTELLKKLWPIREMSASIIAERIGGVLRNAVIGKALRIGLSPRGKRAAKTARIGGQRTVRKAAKTRSAGVFSKAFEKELSTMESSYTEPIIEDFEVPLDTRKTLTQLKTDSCRWPIGDPCAKDFYFCGMTQVSDPKIHYCIGHARRAFQPARSG